MVDLATRRDLLLYCYRFALIYRKVLREGVNFNAVGIVSREQGALVFFEFKAQPRRKFEYKLIDGPIAKAVEKLPQRAFAGNLSSVRFLGKNVIAEGNKLIIIKGDNSKEAWSLKEAVKDAVEEVKNIARSR
jgi:hypothetical protein